MAGGAGDHEVDAGCQHGNACCDQGLPVQWLHYSKGLEGIPFSLSLHNYASQPNE